jgi:glycosyltransferase involved in cell wall biosynthesis
MSKGTILLVSGLPLRKPSSFSRQLDLLGPFLRESGLEVAITGPFPEQYDLPGLGSYSISSEEQVRVQWEHLQRAAGKSGAAAAILLGYPDQFPFLQRVPPPPFPVFLWAQFSRPPDPGCFGTALPVPLTERTARFLQESGCSLVDSVIPHGVDTLQLHPPHLPGGSRKEGRDSPVIGTVGAHTPRKRFGDIIETAALLRKRLPATRLVIKTDRIVSTAGDDLGAIARSHAMGDNLTVLTGELHDEQMRDLYWTMDLYVNQSEWEGFCIPVVEAMACGVPVACLPIQGPGEIVPYGDLHIPIHRTLREGGSFLAHADTLKAADLLLQALEDSALLKRLREEGLREYRERYDIRTVARQWKELISRRTGTGVSPARQRPDA